MSTRAAGHAFRNRLEVAVFGMKRSGNHAILGWLLRGLGRRVVHCNDITGADPFRHGSEIETIGIPAAVCRPSWWNRLVGRGDSAAPRLHSARDRYLDREAVRAFAPKDGLLLSYEDRLPDDAIFREFETAHDRLVGRSDQRRRILILRDAHNLFASRLRAPFPATRTLREDVACYKRHAHCFLAIAAGSDAHTMAISFNDWFRSAAYRQRVAAAIGFETDGAPHLPVHPLGAGSSFDGRHFDGRADAMRVLDRFEQCADDPRYREILSDPELLDLTRRIFGDVTGATASGGSAGTNAAR